jgi:predicted XRE-type DNA-binding protein
MQVKRIKGSKAKSQDEQDYAAANFVTRAELMSSVADTIREKGWTQGQAAEFLGVGQPRISDVFQGRVDRFSVDMLMVWLQKLGKDVSVSVKDNVFSSDEKVILTLYVCGTPEEQLLTNVARLFAGDQDKYELQIVDVLRNAELAHKERISSTPCLIKESPAPRIVLTGDLSAASIRWQLSIAERVAQEQRQDQLDARQLELEQRQAAQDWRRSSEVTHEKDQSRRQGRS